MKKIIIVGSSGFVGKSLNNFLNKKNYKIINFSRSNKKDILKVKKLPKSNYIIYCVKTNDVKKSLYLFKHFENLLKNYSKKIKILFFSSGSVYGPRFQIKKFKETDKVSLKKINNFNNYKKNYSKEKIFLEKEFIKLSEEGFIVSIARCFTFVGKFIPTNSHFLIGNLIKNIIDKKDLLVKSKKKIVRSFMHTDDLVRCLFLIMKKSKNNYKTYNVGSDDQINIDLLIKKLSNKYQTKQKRFYNNMSKKNDYYVPNINKIKKDLKWKNKYNSFEAIIKTIKDFSKLK